MTALSTSTNLRGFPPWPAVVFHQPTGDEAMPAEIIAFTARHRPPSTEEPPPAPTMRRALPPPLTITARNQRLRHERWEAWRKANAATEYWRALLDLEHAVSIAKQHNLKEAHGMCATNRDALVDNLRDAIGRQLLTPACSITTVEWKRRHSDQVPFIVGVDEDDVAKAIAEDVAWLNNHETGTSRANKLRKQRRMLQNGGGNDLPPG
jgi:hypothetical protein